LQIYNEQIGDLLDPGQRNLEVGFSAPVLGFLFHQPMPSLKHLTLISLYLTITIHLKFFFQIKDDPKNGLYVENLTEEYVSSYEDVTQLLIKVGRLLFLIIPWGLDLFRNSWLAFDSIFNSLSYMFLLIFQ
jgi:kinesin family protein 15